MHAEPSSAGHSEGPESRNNGTQVIPVETSSAAQSLSTHPWRRCFARLFDFYLFAVTLGVFLGILFPTFLDDPSATGDERLNNILLDIIVSFVFAPFEAFVLFAFGSTLGKALYGIELRDANGHAPPLGLAAKRAFSVWAKGIGFGIPIIALFTMIAAYRKLTRRGRTSWDARYGFHVSHSKLGSGRWALIGICWLVSLALLAVLVELGSTSNKAADMRSGSRLAQSSLDPGSCKLRNPVRMAPKNALREQQRVVASS